ncbi:hypothetical protein PILCRDRAFT_12905 [Piloderma croceum F 1598]|uniref:Uncharacterized protein n=1 Tax=Piloderma croceum (strain F 1598) TaxID=765440 RepID=A0A0C3F9C3_PILCF|nr:hypothetical protein PILCRDRAFT_12905 [Piloderma croceum F 1598]
MSPMPPDPSNVFSDEESEGFEEIEIKITAPEDSDSPKEQITTEKLIWESPEDEDGYRSEDDLSKPEGEDIGAKEWKKAESNRHLGYGNKSSDRTQWWRRQKKKEKENKDEKSRNYNSAHMMRSYFEYSGPIVSDEEDLESPEELTSETSPPNHPDDFDPMLKTIEYESDTSNESDDDIWEDDWPEEDQVEEDESRGTHSEDKMIEPESQPRQKQ